MLINDVTMWLVETGAQSHSFCKL